MYVLNKNERYDTHEYLMTVKRIARNFVVWTSKTMILNTGSTYHCVGVESQKEIIRSEDVGTLPVICEEEEIDTR